ncbi:MAG TPA: TadE/TadG family type IV pilus assembly protein [Pyrinomonadaceae bacterium]|nr:TadE/TadG family type IV pilus assembly protein [Pyrinomonadaceae bacterium]
MKNVQLRKNERGTTVAEFAMVAMTFFVLIFGIIEFGRMLYTHNALADATRRGARYAVLHPADELAVQNLVVYGANATFDDEGNPTSAPVISGLTTEMVKVTFEGEDLDGDPDTEPTGFGSNLGTATVRIDGFAFNLLIPLIGRAVPMGDYATTLSAESAGEIPDDVDPDPDPTPESTPEPTPAPSTEPTPEATPEATPAG